jgi:hypothetical protein
MDLFGAWAKRRALRKYAGLLPGQLARDYGAAEFYTPGQIRSAVGRLKLDIGYVVYAYAMFLPADEFGALEPSPPGTYDELRVMFRRYIVPAEGEAHFTESGTGFNGDGISASGP